MDNNVAQRKDYFFLDLFWQLSRRNADSHNYKKVLFDTLEKGGLVSDDRYILDRTQGIEIDTKNPRVILILDGDKGHIVIHSC